MPGSQWNVEAARKSNQCCAPDPSHATLSITTTAKQPIIQCGGDPNPILNSLSYALQIKAQLHPNGANIFFHNLAGILIWSCCAFVMPYHLLCMFCGDWPDYCKEHNVGFLFPSLNHERCLWHSHSRVKCRQCGCIFSVSTDLTLAVPLLCCPWS